MNYESLEVITIMIATNKHEHRIFNHETESFLCYGLDYTSSRGKLVVYYPLSFKTHQDAQNFIDKKETIGSVQESLSNLCVGFVKESVVLRPWGYQDREAKLRRMDLNELLRELPDNLVLAKDDNAPGDKRWMIQYNVSNEDSIKSCKSGDPKTTVLECLLKING